MGMLLHRRGVTKDERKTKLKDVTPISEKKPTETEKKSKKQ